MSTHREAALNDKQYVDPNPLPPSVPHVDELGVTSAPLKSASFFIGDYCREVNGEYSRAVRRFRRGGLMLSATDERGVEGWFETLPERDEEEARCRREVGAYCIELHGVAVIVLRPAFTPAIAIPSLHKPHRNTNTTRTPKLRTAAHSPPTRFS